MKTEEMDEIKKSLSFMSEELSKVSKQQTKLMELMDEVKLLKTIIKEKNERIMNLERKVDDLEQYTRMEDIIITGLETRQQTYARAVMNVDKSEDAPAHELQTLKQQIIQFFNNLNMPIKSDDIAACHTLPKRENGKANIIVRFSNGKSKVGLLKEAKKNSGTGVYINI